MRFALHLILAVTGVVVLVTVLGSWMRIQDERHALLIDIQDDHFRFARALARVVEETWIREDEAEARRVLSEANKQDNDLEIGLVPFQPMSDELDVRSRRNGEMARDNPHVQIADDSVIVEFPLRRISDIPRWSLRVSQRLDVQEKIMHSSIVTTVISTLVLLLVCSGLIALLGYWLIARPISRVIGLVRRVGNGELDARLDLAGRDEIGELAREIEAMAQRLKNAQLANLEALEQLRHADRLRSVGQLASGLAHEIGTPLNVVKGRARLIQEADGVTDEIIDEAQVIVDQTERITELVKQLLGFARQGSSRRQSIFVSSLLDRVRDLIAPMAQRNNVESEVISRESIPPIDADPTLLEQALLNIAVNGLHAMKETGGSLRFEASTEDRLFPRSQQTLPAVVVSISDTGVGIDEDVRPRIFDPFFTTKDVGEGTGLGLSVVFGIVEEHGGFLEVQSRKGHGSKFTMVLPLHAST